MMAGFGERLQGHSEQGLEGITAAGCSVFYSYRRCKAGMLPLRGQEMCTVATCPARKARLV